MKAVTFVEFVRASGIKFSARATSWETQSTSHGTPMSLKSGGDMCRGK